MSSSRRAFLKHITAIGATAALSGWSIAPLSSNNTLPRKVGANEKVNLACIGIGNRGGVKSSKRLTRPIFAIS